MALALGILIFFIILFVLFLFFGLVIPLVFGDEK